GEVSRDDIGRDPRRAGELLEVLVLTRGRSARNHVVDQVVLDGDRPGPAGLHNVLVAAPEPVVLDRHVTAGDEAGRAGTATLVELGVLHVDVIADHVG